MFISKYTRDFVELYTVKKKQKNTYHIDHQSFLKQQWHLHLENESNNFSLFLLIRHPHLLRHSPTKIRQKNRQY